MLPFGFPMIMYLLPSLGLSLRSQELTAIFLAVRVFCSFTMEGDIHTVLDVATLVSTVWVIYMMRFKLKSTYIKELDNMHSYFMVSSLFAVLRLILTYCSYRFYYYTYLGQLDMAQPQLLTCCRGSPSLLYEINVFSRVTIVAI